MPKPKYEIGQKVRIIESGQEGVIVSVCLPTRYMYAERKAFIDPVGVPKYRLVGVQMFYQEHELTLA